MVVLHWQPIFLYNTGKASNGIVERLSMDVNVVIELAKEEVELLSRPIHGQGGFQTLLRRLQSQLNEESQLVLGIDDVERIARYCAKYKTGGFQDQLKSVLSALERLTNALRFP